MLSIIIITYNSHQVIANCLRSLFTNQLDLPFHVILIDNNSTDQAKTKKALEEFKEFMPGQLTCLDNPHNLGFAKAVNQGIRFGLEKYDSQYFLLLNPDATLGNDCMQQLVDHARSDKTLGLLSATILQPDNNSPWFTGGSIDWLGVRTRHIIDKAATLSTTTNSSGNSYLTGCCLFIKRAVVEKTGLFDEKFFLYYEDADYSIRAQKDGFKITTVPNAICYHEESQSSTSANKTYHLCLSGLIFFHKHIPPYLRPYFWGIYWLRFAYHTLASGKKEVIAALKDFRKQA